MKCPECGQWNRASLPHCINCGAPLNIDEASRLPWKDALKDNPSGQGDELTPLILIRPLG